MLEQRFRKLTKTAKMLRQKVSKEKMQCEVLKLKNLDLEERLGDKQSQVEELINGNKFIEDADRAKQRNKHLERLFNKEKKKNDRLSGEFKIMRTLLVKGNICAGFPCKLLLFDRIIYYQKLVRSSSNNHFYVICH